LKCRSNGSASIADPLPQDKTWTAAYFSSVGMAVCEAPTRAARLAHRLLGAVPGYVYWPPAETAADVRWVTKL
jgi:hypothetical protein